MEKGRERERERERENTAWKTARTPRAKIKM